MTSERTPVTNNVSQSSVLRSVLFVMYINDFDLGLNNFISKCADDTKIANFTLLECDSRSLKEDLRKIIKLVSKMGNVFQYKHVPDSVKLVIEIYKRTMKCVALKLKAFTRAKILVSQSRLSSNIPSNATSLL